MITEGVIVTREAAGQAHITPLGFRRSGDEVILRPFVPSRTLDNLRRHPQAVMNLTDDCMVTAGCLTGRRDWPVVSTERVSGWRLADCPAHLELEVTRVVDDIQRPTFYCEVVAEVAHRAYVGFNRATAAVIEAAILVSRLDFIDPDKLEHEMTYLHTAISKTAGDDEWTAWRWLLDAIANHKRVFFDVGALR